MTKTITSTACFAALLMAGSAWADKNEGNEEQIKRIRESAGVLHEIMDAGDKSIPQDLLQKAYCVGIVPSLKRVGFIVGGTYGKGIVTCRTDMASGWSAPSTIRVEGGNIGFQIGAGETDLVFVVMSKKGEDDLMRDKFTIGVDATGMAGPVGRQATAETDAMLRAEILSYSRSHGVFAGVALDGSTLRPDKDANTLMYGAGVTQHEILNGKIAAPEAAKPLFAELNQYAPAQKRGAAERQEHEERHEH